MLDGPQAGASAVTDSTGVFVFPGVFDDSVRFRASKDGYVEAIRTSNAPGCASCARWIQFDLESPSAAVADLAGQYDLTFTAAESCAGIPPDLRSRTYVASVTQDPTSRWRYVVSVSEPSVLHGHSWEGITVGTTIDHATLYVGNYHGDPGVVDQVDGDSYLSFDGWMSIPIGSPSVLSGAFEGYIDYCVLPPGSASPVTTGRYICGAGTGVPNAPGTRRSCLATNHRLVLSRR